MPVAVAVACANSKKPPLFYQSWYPKTSRPPYGPWQDEPSPWLLMATSCECHLHAQVPGLCGAWLLCMGAWCFVSFCVPFP